MTNLIDVVFRKLSGNLELDAADSIIFENVESLIPAILRFHASHEPPPRAPIIRKKISEFSKAYTRKVEMVIGGGHAIEEAQIAIDDLANSSSPSTLVLMSAHQPNLFPYSGVMRKIVLLEFLAKRIKEKEGRVVKAVPFYAFADHDFVHNKWVRSAELESPMRKEGTLRFNVKIDPKTNFLPSHLIPKPSDSLLENWHYQMINWIKENSSLAKRFLRTILGYPDPADAGEEALRSFEEFWIMVVKAHRVSSNLAEFSSLLLASVAIGVWNMPIVFANFSDCFTLFSEEYSWLIDQYQTIRKVIDENERLFNLKGIDSGLSADISETSPLWLKCGCGSKYRLELVDRHIAGKCLGCGKDIAMDLPELNRLILLQPDLFEPRSIFMPIVFSRTLHMSCYVGGIGGIGYLMHSKAVSNALSNGFPPAPFWYSGDRFLSLQKLAAMAEVDRARTAYSKSDLPVTQENYRAEAKQLLLLIERNINNGSLPRSPVAQRDRQILDRVVSKESDSSSSCMIDYAVNISIAKSGYQWEKFLRNDGRLLVPVPMESFLDVDRAEKSIQQVPI